MITILDIFVIFVAVCEVQSSNILYLHGVISGSHHIWNRALAKGLAIEGHNVTFLSVDHPKVKDPNLHYIALEGVYEELYSEDSSIAFDIMEFSRQSKIEASRGLTTYGLISCEIILKAKGLDVILNYPDDFKFDLIIYDFTCGPCLLPLIHKFNYPPLVAVSPFLIPPYTTNLIGGNKYPAYVPHYLINYPQIMSFRQRLFNFFIYTLEALSFEFEMYPELEKLARERFPFDFPSLKKLERKTDLMLLNSDFAVDYAEPLQPNMILVGGLQITQPKELPSDMKKFVESGKKGTVLMSLGTNIKSNLLGDDVLKAILKTFESISDYNFIWKFESEADKLPAKPSKNVMVGKFLPQNDLLAHPNLKMFITHAGALSTQESLWYGKPMVGIPFIADQHRNLAKLLRTESAIKVDIATFTAENFRKSILTVLEDPKFTKNAQEISTLFQDKPMKPMERAIWWIEYVLRHPKASLYRSPSLELGYLVSNSFDIYLFILITLIVVIVIIKKLFKMRLQSNTQKVKIN